MAALWALMQPTVEHGTTRRGTTAVGTQFVEVRCLFQDILSVWMLFALDRKTVVDAVRLLEQVKEWFPRARSLLAGQKRFGVANDDERVTSSR